MHSSYLRHSRRMFGCFFLHLSQCFCCLLKFLFVFKEVCPTQRVCKERRVPSQECLRVWVGLVGVGEGDGWGRRSSDQYSERKNRKRNTFAFGFVFRLLFWLCFVLFGFTLIGFLMFFVSCCFGDFPFRFVCLLLCLFVKYALRVSPAVTRLTVYRGLRVYKRIPGYL